MNRPSDGWSDGTCVVCGVDEIPVREQTENRVGPRCALCEYAVGRPDGRIDEMSIYTAIAMLFHRIHQGSNR